MFSWLHILPRVTASPLVHDRYIFYHEIKLFRIFLRVLDSRTSTSINIAAYIPPYPSHCPCCLSQLREHDTDDEKAVELEAALKIKCGTFFGRGKTLFGLATCYLLDAA